jgi:predicted PurR-regulated permease PerM
VGAAVLQLLGIGVALIGSVFTFLVFLTLLYYLLAAETDLVAECIAYLPIHNLNLKDKITLDVKNAVRSA